ncbi:MAG: hypothetical protein CMO40_04280 [Verrucomicrobiaceae bacterium]|nr:hypothetical protein [Verrucomicrobiaceae bacterium]
MRFLLFALPVAIGISTILVQAQDDSLLRTRSWVSKEGKSLKATLTRVTASGIRLRVARSGKVIEVPLERLSIADRQATMAWLRENPDGLVPPRPPFRWPDRYQGEQQPKVTYERYDRQQRAHLFSARYYTLLSDNKLSESTVSKCAAVFNAVVGALDSLPLALAPVPLEAENRYQAFLFSSRAEYQRRGGPPNSAGVYIPSRNLTMMPYASLGIVKKGTNWVFDGTRRDFGVLIHELTHQALLRRWAFLPVWFHEGIAEYMQAMPYRSGQFLFTNPGAAVSKHIRDGIGRLYEEFPCTRLESLLTLELRMWNQINSVDPRRSLRNYASAEIAVCYFMHADGAGDGSHFISWIHDLKRAARSAGNNWPARKRALTEKHLLRGRSWSEVEGEIRKFLRQKGLRVVFSR